VNPRGTQFPNLRNSVRRRAKASINEWKREHASELVAGRRWIYFRTLAAFESVDQKSSYFYSEQAGLILCSVSISTEATRRWRLQ
jgi:hypothetical protein